MTCHTCNGTGEVKRRQQSPLFGTVITATPCSACGGTGEVIPSLHQVRRAQVSARHTQTQRQDSAGVDKGTRIRLVGEGEAGQMGGPPGNLYVVVSVDEHPGLGADLLLELPINVAQAALGATLKIPTLEGSPGSWNCHPARKTAPSSASAAWACRTCNATGAATC